MSFSALSYPVTARLFLVGLAAVALSQTASNLLGLWLASPLAAPGEQIHALHSRELPPPPLDGALLERRFGLESAPLPARPDARLRGTLVSTLESASVALIESGTRSVVVRVGDVWGSFIVDRIERRRVWLASTRGRTAIEAGEAVAAEAPSRVERSAGGAYEVSRAEVARLLADPMRLAAQAFFTPSPNGWVISRLSNDSELRQLGVLPGDEIRALNGRPANKLETLMGAAQELPNAPRVQVDLIRAGAPIRLEYDLR
jgi:type II secretory pathway component PulC